MSLRALRGIRGPALLMVAAATLTGVVAAGGLGGIPGLVSHNNQGAVAVPIASAVPAPLRADSLFPAVAAAGALHGAVVVPDPVTPSSSTAPPAAQAVAAAVAPDAAGCYDECAAPPHGDD